MVVRIITAMLSILWSISSGAADIRAQVDRNPVAVNESFQLNFVASGSVDEDPDFAPLETYFDILSRNQSSQIQVINGRMQRSQQWHLTLMAREPGQYSIPAIAFGDDRSNILPLSVNPEPAPASGDTAGPIMLETELQPEQAYVQSQVIYTVRLLRSVTLRSGELSAPTVSGVEAVIEKLGEDRSFETTREGVRYAVVERSYAIFPQQSGEMILAPTVFQGQYLQGNRFSFNEALRNKRVKSPAYTVSVLPVPANASRPWLPAKELRLVEEWPQDPPAFRVGEPLTRTITLMAAGVTAAQLPPLAAPPPQGLKQYPDQPKLQDQTQTDGIIGVRQEKIAIMPTHGGSFTLPAVEIPWWNTRTGQPEVTRIPARRIEVAAATQPMPAPPASPMAAAAPVATAQNTPPSPTGAWPWISLVLALGWVATALLWWRHPRTTQPRQRHRPVTPDLRAVKRACRQQDANACKTALLDWAQGQWPQRPPTSLGALAARVDGDFATAIGELNQLLYGAAKGDWDASALLRATTQWRRTQASAADRNSDSIAPLYPHSERQT